MASYPFPGMNPYLERRSLWPNVHLNLINAIQFELANNLPEPYYVSAEERTYIAANDPDTFIGRPDVAVVGSSGKQATQVASPATNGSPTVVVLPIPDEIRENYLEIRDTSTDRVITVIEVLSPANKRPGEGRRAYEEKRRSVLRTATNLVEIDLLRLGDRMPFSPQFHQDYSILVSREWERPRAQLYGWSLADPIPAIPIPLREDEQELLVSVGPLLQKIYADMRYERRIDYTAPPPPPELSEEQAAWLDALLKEHNLR